MTDLHSPRGAANSTRPFRIAIVGGGTAGWMCAAALRNGLSHVDYALTLIESTDIGTVGVGEATLPCLKQFNDQLGLEEADLMRATGATFKLGIYFSDWDRPGKAYLHPFGVFGESWNGIEFQHHWYRAAAAGSALPLEEYSFAASLAGSNRFALPTAEPQAIRSTYSYAYHLDSTRYCALLREWATRRGVHRIEDRVVQVNRDPESGDLEALTLQSGVRVEADLFVDCSGFRALLLADTLARKMHERA
ncbi:MAG: FAD-dependent oxidoreductase [Steroidobacteraceae bacterium]